MPTWDTKKPIKKTSKKPTPKVTTKKPVSQTKSNIANKITDNTVSQEDNQINNEVVIMQEEQKWTNWWLIVFLIILWIAAAMLFILLGNIKPGSSNLANTINWSNPKNNNTNSSEAPKGEKVNDGTVHKWDKIKVNYVWKLEDWTVFDSSLEEFAKKSPDYKADSGRKYEPLEFTVWAEQMIKWFDAWVVGMKVGEKKTLTIKPEDAYGAATISQDVPKKYLSDNIEQEVPESSFRDYITQTVPKEALWEKWNNLKVGEELNSEWMTWTVEAITASGVTIKIENKENPFFGKKIVVWTKADYQWNTITIKKITKDNITVDVLNKQSPFFGKKLVEWLTWKLPNWDEVKIEKINWETITVSTKNPHKLAWKTLIFDVELKEIVK